MGKRENQIRENWVDNIKLLACILVAMGHFFQSMVRADILSDSKVYEWFERTIYYFHVPLFFICSGYLYQQYSKVASAASWRNNILRKLLTLGIPYFTFSSVTWAMKTVFSGAVNEDIGGIIHTLLIVPTSPYWYLYCLFLIFLITPTFSSLKMAKAGLLIALIFKVICLAGWGKTGIFAVSTVLENEIWFVLGMLISITEWKKWLDKRWRRIGAGSAAVFVIVSIIVYEVGVQGEIIEFVLGIWACGTVIIMLYGREARSSVWEWIANYTMPIFLMHTIFAAGLRIVLLKVGIRSAAIHIPLGIVISFAGPIIAAIVMGKVWKLDFLLYPGRYIRGRK
ncbi:MAG: acyltransferase [Lachnospiraceae bacterium]|nr:acyltransferase [Lachnospiraceae bacterium]